MQLAAEGEIFTENPKNYFDRILCSFRDHTVCARSTLESSKRDRKSSSERARAPFHEKRASDFEKVYVCARIVGNLLSSQKFARELFSSCILVVCLVSVGACGEEVEAGEVFVSPGEKRNYMFCNLTVQTFERVCRALFFTIGIASSCLLRALYLQGSVQFGVPVSNSTNLFSCFKGPL